MKKDWRVLQELARMTTRMNETKLKEFEANHWYAKLLEKFYHLEAKYVRERQRIWRLRKQIRHLQKGHLRKNREIEVIDTTNKHLTDMVGRLSREIIRLHQKLDGVPEIAQLQEDGDLEEDQVVDEIAKIHARRLEEGAPHF